MKNKNQLVSIIVPIYNVSDYLEEAINSVIHQTYNNLEIILVNDGSTDNCGNICDEFKRIDKRIKVINQSNKGLSVARNTGLDLMNGDVVAFLDSDDVYLPNYVETMLLAMNNENSDLVVCKYTQFTTYGVGIKSKKNEPSAVPGVYDRVTALKSLVDGTIDVHAWNRLYRRELWNGIRFAEGRVFEDGEIAYAIMDKISKLKIIEQPLYLFRKRPGSISSSISSKKMEDWLFGMSHIEIFVNNNVPQIFTHEQLKTIQQSVLNGMMYYYITLLREKRTDSKDVDELRKEILTRYHEVGLDDRRKKRKIILLLIRAFPELLKIYSYLYYSFH